MEIYINGEKKEVDSPPTIREILDGAAIKSKRIAVEVNLKIIPKKDHDSFRLQEGDRMEIVHPVGGG